MAGEGEPEVVSGGHLVAKALKAEGVDLIFTLGRPGPRPGRQHPRRRAYSEFARMLGGYGEEVRDPAGIRPTLQRARESGTPSLINVWVDPEVYAPGTMNQTMYK
jgi:thiamine pyrophosphate-dependent acetolactate synthase large subunit-like protein